MRRAMFDDVMMCPSAEADGIPRAERVAFGYFLG